MLKSLVSIFTIVLLQSFFSQLLAINSGFIENKGQVLNQNKEVATEILYILNTSDLKVTLREDGFSYERFKSTWSDAEIKSFIADENADVNIPFISHRIDFTFPNQPTEIRVENESDFNLNYYNKTDQPITGVKQFNKVLYKNVADGIDVEFLITKSGAFKYNIIVTGSADLTSFFILLSGADDLSIDANGGLVIYNSIKDIKEEIPESFYIANEQTKRVDVHYELEGDKLFFRTDTDFSNGKLIIDPEPDLVWGSYFGGSSSDASTGLAVDQNDNVFQTGITLSIDNISTTGSFQTNYAGDLDVYVSKFDRFGALLWSTYYGDEQSERAYSIDVDEKGDAYLGANTFSVTGISTPGVYQEYLAGADDMFILKLNENGLREWCTYYGGNAHDFITTITYSESKIYVTGHTTSSNGIASQGAYLESFTANECGFIGCLESDGTALSWGTYFGEELSTSGEDLIVFDGYVAMTGRTTSNIGIASEDAHQENHVGFVSAFLTLFDVQGSYLWGTYYGGIYSNVGRSLTVDELNNIYFAGNSNSPDNIATAGAYQGSPSDEHGFLAKFNIDGNRIWGTYVGGNSADYIKVIDYKAGNLLIGGQTASTNDIASSGVYQEFLNAGFDMFFKYFDTAGVYKWGSYYGGENNEDIYDLAFLSNGNFSVVGSTVGSQTGIATSNAHQENYGGGQDDGVIGLFCRRSSVTIDYIGGFLIANGGTDIEWYYDGSPIGEYGDTITPIGDGVYMVVNSTEGACETTSDEYVLNTSSVAGNQQNYDVNIYPNPATSYLNIELGSGFEIVNIYDSMGRKVLFVLNDLSLINMDISVLNEGIYFIEIVNHNEKYTYKFIKQ